MLMIQTIGVIMSALWVLYVTVGLGSQIYKNSQEKRFGWSLPLFLLAIATYVFGVWYGILSGDIFILIPYLVGSIFFIIMIIQFFTLKK
jgi:hypothetical protein